MPYSPEQVKTFEEVFGFVPDEASVKSVKGFIQTIMTDEAVADAAGIASKAEAPAAEDVATDTADVAEADTGTTEFIGDMTPDEFRTFMSSIISDAMVGAVTKSEIPTTQITALQSELTTIKSEIGKPNAQTEAKIADLEQRFKALLSEQPRQVAAAYDPTKDDRTIVQTAAKADVGDPALNDVVGWLIPSRT